MAQILIGRSITRGNENAGKDMVSDDHGSAERSAGRSVGAMATPALLASSAGETVSKSTVDHSKLTALQSPLNTRLEVTKACLTCHNQAGQQVM